MALKIILLCIFIASTLADVLDNNTVNDASPSDTQVHAVYPETSAITWNRYTITGTILAAVLVVVGVYALITLFMPLITYKLCYIFGYCPYALPNYIDEYLAEAQNHPRLKRSTEYLNLLTDTLAAAYQKYGVYLAPEGENDEQRDKRQTDYLGPLLHTLAVAYDKYQDGDNPKKNFKSGMLSRK